MADTGDFADSWSGGIASESQTLNTILSCVQTLQQQTNFVASQNVEIMARMSVLEKHFQLGMAPVEEPADASKLNWNCPLCGLQLQDEASFKGHIRRLVHASRRPKCHVNCRDRHRDQLVHRFQTGLMILILPSAIDSALLFTVLSDAPFHHVTVLMNRSILFKLG